MYKIAKNLIKGDILNIAENISIGTVDRTYLLGNEVQVITTNLDIFYYSSDKLVNVNGGF